MRAVVLTFNVMELIDPKKKLLASSAESQIESELALEQKIANTILAQNLLSQKQNQLKEEINCMGETQNKIK